jgi:hypothetical protein
MSDRPTRFDIRNWKPFGNPTHGIAKGDTENTHHKVYVGVSSAHVADKAAHAVLSFKEVQGRIGVAVPVVFNSPASCSPVTDVQSKRLCDFEDRDMLLNPGCVRLWRSAREWDHGDIRAHRSPPTKSGIASASRLRLHFS